MGRLWAGAILSERRRHHDLCTPHAVRPCMHACVRARRCVAWCVCGVLASILLLDAVVLVLIGVVHRTSSLPSKARQQGTGLSISASVGSEAIRTAFLSATGGQRVCSILPRLSARGRSLSLGWQLTDSCSAFFVGCMFAAFAGLLVQRYSMPQVWVDWSLGAFLCRSLCSTTAIHDH